MVIHKTTDYAIQILCCLARANRPMSSSKLASLIGVSSRYLLYTGGLLKRSGLVNVVNGSNGGYILCREPKLITVWDVVLATDTQFFMLLSNDMDEQNSLKLFYRDTYELIKHCLQQTTIWDLVTR